MTTNSPSIELPKYLCHKKVWALKIASIRLDSLGVYILKPEDPQYAEFPLTEEYVTKHKPVEGGYYVVYEDGYKSFSPADAFEGGYSLIK